MKTILICPADQSEVPLLSTEAPLAAIVALGTGLVEYWMSHLAGSGVKEVTLLAHDRIEAVRKAVGHGSRWGLTVKIIAEGQQLTPEGAAEKYGLPAMTMDHFPDLPELPLFESYGHWYKGLEAWMPRAKTCHRVGVMEKAPQVWVGLHGHISPEARLLAPCWIGAHVYVGPGAVIGPGAILENGAFIEGESEIKGSVVGPATFVGQYLTITDSLAWGHTLVNWRTGTESTISDEFLLCSVNRERSTHKGIPLLDRAKEWLNGWGEPTVHGAPTDPGEEKQLVARQGVAIAQFCSVGTIDTSPAIYRRETRPHN